MYCNHGDNSLLRKIVLLGVLVCFSPGGKAAITDSTKGRIYGSAPTVSGSVNVLSPGNVNVSNNMLVSKKARPNDFKIDVTNLTGLVLSDPDGDTGLSAVIDAGTSVLEWKNAGNFLSEAELSQPFKNSFLGKRLTVRGSVDITAQSVTGLPSISFPMPIQSGEFTVIIPDDFNRIVVSESNVRIFGANDGFPQTGFKGAYFHLYAGSTSTTNSLYNWNSSEPTLASVDSSGKVMFINEFPSGAPEITITALPKNLDNTSLIAKTFNFKVKYWFINGGLTGRYWADSNNYCLSKGYSLPGYALLTAAIPNPGTGISPVPDPAMPAVGALWSEWGPPANYSLGEWSTGSYWAAGSFNINKYRVSLTYGDVNNVAPTAFRFLTACVREL